MSAYINLASMYLLILDIDTYWYTYVAHTIIKMVCVREWVRASERGAKWLSIRRHRYNGHSSSSNTNQISSMSILVWQQESVRRDTDRPNVVHISIHNLKKMIELFRII